MKRLDFRTSVWKDQGNLLYLSPQDAEKLILLLHNLSQCLRSKSRSAEAVHAIRKDLSDLLHLLSPLSKTGKILFELLEETGVTESLDRKNIQRLAKELQDLCQIRDLAKEQLARSFSESGKNKDLK